MLQIFFNKEDILYLDDRELSKIVDCKKTFCQVTDTEGIETHININQIKQIKKQPNKDDVQLDTGFTI